MITPIDLDYAEITIRRLRRDHYPQITQITQIKNPQDQVRATGLDRIVGRDVISDSKFKGWTFQQEVEAFDKAITVNVR